MGWNTFLISRIVQFSDRSVRCLLCRYVFQMGRPDKNIYGPDLIRVSENGKSNHNPVKTKPDPGTG